MHAIQNAFIIKTEVVTLKAIKRVLSSPLTSNIFLYIFLVLPRKTEQEGLNWCKFLRPYIMMIEIVILSTFFERYIINQMIWNKCFWEILLLVKIMQVKMNSTNSLKTSTFTLHPFCLLSSIILTLKIFLVKMRKILCL